MNYVEEHVFRRFLVQIVFKLCPSLLGCGNCCLVSARLSLKRHYPLTNYFQSIFREVSLQF